MRRDSDKHCRPVSPGTRSKLYEIQTEKRVNIMENTDRKGDTEGIGVKCECE